MNKKLIKTIASLTLGLGTIATIPVIVTSCGGDKPDTGFYLMAGPGSNDSDESETRTFIMVQFVDPTYQDMYSLKVTLKTDLSAYTTLFFGYTDGQAIMEPLLSANVQFNSTGFTTSWVTDAIQRPVLKLVPTDVTARKINFTLSYKGLEEKRCNLDITFSA